MALTLLLLQNGPPFGVLCLRVLAAVMLPSPISCLAGGVWFRFVPWLGMLASPTG